MVFAFKALLCSAFFFGAVIAFGAASASPTRAEEHDALRPLLAGPFEASNQQPIEMMHRGFVPTSPYTLAPGSYLLSLDGIWANTLNRRRGSYLFDAETRSARPSLRVGLTEALEIQIDQPLLWRGAGFTDSLIDGWHEAFALPQGPRQFVPQDRFSLQGQTRNGENYVETRDGIGLVDAQLSTKYRVIESDRALGSLQLAGSVPTGSAGYGQGTTDLTVGALGSYDLDHTVRLFAGVGYTYMFDPWQKQLLFRRQQVQGFLGMTFFIGDKLAAYIGVNGGSALLENIERFPDYQIYLDVGIKHAIGSRSFFSVFIRENPSPSEGTTDVAMEFGFSQLFF